MEIVELSDKPELIEKAIDFFWNSWGNENNYKFYSDCIKHSVDKSRALPKFYLGIKDGIIIASYALLTNDIISRQDLYPWLACLFVKADYRNGGIAGELLNHGISETVAKGFKKLYLSTDLENFYEKKGWVHIGYGFNPFDQEFKIYEKAVK